MQALLDDFCIPLQLATGSTQEHDPASKDKVSQLTDYRLALKVYDIWRYQMFEVLVK